MPIGFKTWSPQTARWRLAIGARSCSRQSCVSGRRRYRMRDSCGMRRGKLMGMSHEDQRFRKRSGGMHPKIGWAVTGSLIKEDDP